MATGNRAVIMAAGKGDEEPTKRFVGFVPKDVTLGYRNFFLLIMYGRNPWENFPRPAWQVNAAVARETVDKRLASSAMWCSEEWGNPEAGGVLSRLNNIFQVSRTVLTGTLIGRKRTQLVSNVHLAIQAWCSNFEECWKTLSVKLLFISLLHVWQH